MFTSLQLLHELMHKLHRILTYNNVNSYYFSYKNDIEAKNTVKTERRTHLTSRNIFNFQCVKQAVMKFRITSDVLLEFS